MTDTFSPQPSPRLDLSWTQFDPFLTATANSSFNFTGTFPSLKTEPAVAYPSSEDELNGSVSSVGRADLSSSSFNSPFLVDESTIPMQYDAVAGSLDSFGPPLVAPGEPFPVSTFSIARDVPFVGQSAASPHCDAASSHNDDSSYDSPVPETKSSEMDLNDTPAASARKRARKPKIALPELEDSDDDGSLDHLSKRERNKLSAAKYRKRRKVYMGALESKVSQMEKALAAKTAEASSLRQQNQTLISKVSVLEEQLTFLKGLLGPAAKAAIPNSRARGTMMFVLFAAFLLVLPFSFLQVSTESDPFDHSVSGHRGRIILSLPEASWWDTLATAVQNWWFSVCSAESLTSVVKAANAREFCNWNASRSLFPAPVFASA